MLKSKLLEEPSVHSTGISFFKQFSERAVNFLLLGWILGIFSRESGLKVKIVYGITSKHNVIQVDDLDEWLNTGPLADFLLTHITGDRKWSTVDTDYKSVSVSTIGSTFLTKTINKIKRRKKGETRDKDQDPCGQPDKSGLSIHPFGWQADADSCQTNN